MVTFLILLPVACVLVWLYWLCLPKNATKPNSRWRWIDSALIISLALLASLLVKTILNTEFVDAGPIWPEVVAATSAYGVITIGLAIGLTIRHRSAHKR